MQEGIEHVRQKPARRWGATAALSLISIVGATPIIVKSEYPLSGALVFVALSILYTATGLYSITCHGRRGIVPTVIAFAVLFGLVETNALMSPYMTRKDTHFISFTSFLLSYSIFVLLQNSATPPGHSLD